LWNACRDVLLFWIARGVKIFSISNPQLNALTFWERAIADVRRAHPDVIFLAEAFTRPKRSKSLAKIGFGMSYTYFPWKNTEWELRQYFAELTQTQMVEYYRGILFPTNPDILNEFFVTGGQPAFRLRLLLAATLSPLYGIYSGYELGENEPAGDGTERYLTSETYELRPRDYDAVGNINADILRLNTIRRSQPALHEIANLTFHTSENPAILFYRKAARAPVKQWVGCDVVEVPLPVIDALYLEGGGSGGDLLIAVNTDPHRAQETMVHVPLSELGLSDDEPYVVHDLLTDFRYTWRGTRNYIRLDPAQQPGHLLLVERS
jgi:starch synthase (maltosyl-transferring)